MRDADGVWRYRDGGDEVPGATDLRLRDLFDPPVEERDGTPVRVVPRAWASRNPDHPLAWVFEHAELGTREPIVVPLDEWASHTGRCGGHGPHPTCTRTTWWGSTASPPWPG